MKISETQRKFLESLTCHRLSSLDEHKGLINMFVNSRNPGLVDNLKDSAWDEDEEGATAYYLVKDNFGRPLFFFSLKCGGLYQHFDQQALLDLKQQSINHHRLLTNPQNDKEKEIAMLLLDAYQREHGLSGDEVINKLTATVQHKGRLLQGFAKDIYQDPNKHIVRVSHTHSGIELVHFCSNDLMRNVCKRILHPQSLGKVVFWHFIVPIVQQVREVVGCKYLYLFAADNTEDLTLVNYYNIELKLNRPIDIGTSKPIYDFQCIFMCNEISELINHRKIFFQNFNPENAI